MRYQEREKAYLVLIELSGRKRRDGRRRPLYGAGKYFKTLAQARAAVNRAFQEAQK